jgi:hypothetical protein
VAAAQAFCQHFGQADSYRFVSFSEGQFSEDSVHPDMKFVNTIEYKPPEPSEKARYLGISRDL